MTGNFFGGMLDTVSGKSRRERRSKHFISAGKQDEFTREDIQRQMKEEKRKANIRLLVALLIGCGIAFIIILILKHYGTI